MSRHRLGQPAGVETFNGIPNIKSMLVVACTTLIASVLLIYAVGLGDQHATPVPPAPRPPWIVDALPEPSVTPSWSASASLPVPDPSASSTSPSPSVSASASPSRAGTTARSTTAAPRPAPVAVTASYSVRTDWGDGFVADIIVRNASGGPVTWVVDITYTYDVYVSSSNTWNASVERLGPTYRFRSTWVLKAGESVQFGFVASKYQTSSVPSSCVVNGRPCS